MAANILHSSSFRLALVYMALFGGSVLILLVYIYWSTARYMASQADATIEAEITGLAERYRTDGLPGLTALIVQRTSRKPGGSSIYLLVDEDLGPLAGNISRWPDVPLSPDGWLNFRLEDEGWSADQVHPARARAFKLRGGFRLLVGRDLHELGETQRLIVRTLAWGLLITLVLALVGGTMMTRSMVRRIDAINQTSREIMSGDLSRRMPTDHSGDDFDRLTGNLNAMLDRIEALMEEVRRISDNIAHDLKTPLTRLRNSLELLNAGHSGESEQRHALVEQAIVEADGLLSTFNALLRIARVESGERRAGFVELDLTELVRDVTELYEPVAEAKQQKLTLNLCDVAPVLGDRDLLFQSLANLLDNAIKYTPPDGQISVALTTRSERAQLVIADSGQGIPPDDQDNVFRRFYRLETHRATAGNGLGLSLVAAVAKLHEISLTLEDNAPGLRVVMTFPAPTR